MPRLLSPDSATLQLSLERQMRVTALTTLPQFTELEAVGGRASGSPQSPWARKRRLSSKYCTGKRSTQCDARTERIRGVMVVLLWRARMQVPVKSSVEVENKRRTAKTYNRFAPSNIGGLRFAQLACKCWRGYGVVDCECGTILDDFSVRQSWMPGVQLFVNGPEFPSSNPQAPFSICSTCDIECPSKLRSFKWAALSPQSGVTNVSGTHDPWRTLVFIGRLRSGTWSDSAWKLLVALLFRLKNLAVMSLVPNYV
ncbi:hypothetical protein GALMADRAFT_216586 [Galerina marginata CBS 339.88]|uniref:Uncharacterized protein n=1 Tax=Galerina marginata (strain CBS 339.88) TaxID=685588 RepID=A0A067S8Z8_GALM3|nr:hypothetical protein GALMADRAFT_216586 [Galerina marginata CBS 339.88]